MRQISGQFTRSNQPRQIATEPRRLPEDAGLTGYEAAKRTRRIGQRELESEIVGLPADYVEYVRAENRADSIWNWEPQLIPGLLQTTSYTRGVFDGYRSTFERTSTADMEQRLSLRRVRQELLTAAPPLDLQVVIDESALRRNFIDNSVMQEQLNSLVQASRLPNVDIRILPLSATSPLVTGAFSYLRFLQSTPSDDIVIVEHLTGNNFLKGLQQTLPYRKAFDWLRDAALDEDSSRDLISEVADSIWF